MRHTVKQIESNPALKAAYEMAAEIIATKDCLRMPGAELEKIFNPDPKNKGRRGPGRPKKNK
ncbi:MAG: hypothetical protein QMD08_08125 [Actinomycetota bacterium]|nr:hypothetical protein [Actinomycetota bacterium]